MNPMTQEKPTVLIVGAGLGGVTLGLILEAAGVPFSIFEKASSVKPLGMGRNSSIGDASGRKEKAPQSFY